MEDFQARQKRQDTDQNEDYFIAAEKPLGQSPHQRNRDDTACCKNDLLHPMNSEGIPDYDFHNPPCAVGSTSGT